MICLCFRLFKATLMIVSLFQTGEATVEVLKHCIKMEGKEVPSNKVGQYWLVIRIIMTNDGG